MFTSFCRKAHRNINTHASAHDRWQCAALQLSSTHRRRRRRHGNRCCGCSPPPGCCCGCRDATRRAPGNWSGRSRGTETWLFCATWPTGRCETGTVSDALSTHTNQQPLLHDWPIASRRPLTLHFMFTSSRWLVLVTAVSHSKCTQCTLVGIQNLHGGSLERWSWKKSLKTTNW